jgi:pilus assembly protein CpaB
VTPGSHVAIFVSSAGTTTGTTTGSPTTRIMVPSVEVIGVGATTVLSAASGDKTTSSTDAIPETILTVALNQRDSDRVLFAASNGGLAFGLLGQGTNIKTDHGVTASDLLQ